MVEIPAGHQQLSGSERQPVPGARRIGPADPSEMASVTVRLRRRPNAPPLPDPVDVMRQPPARRRYIAREDFAGIYGADPIDVARVGAFAREYGLELGTVNAAARTVAVSGTVEQLSRAFAVELDSYEAAGERYRGREGHVHLPADLADAVEGVFGLDSRRQARPAAGPAQGGSPLTPPQVAGLYDFPSGPATGQCIGLLEFGGGFVQSDLSTFFGGLGQSVPRITAVPVDGATNSPGINLGSDQEVALDISVAGSVAPGASLAVYFAPYTEQGWVDAIATAVHDTVNKPSVLSISWGWAEFETALGLAWTQAAMDAVNASLQEAVALGVTVLAAAGDSGTDCQIGDGQVHVLYPASDPFVTGCGGTSIVNLDLPADSFDQEVWNNANGASGGGVSVMFPAPFWQYAAGTPGQIDTGFAGRGVPDIAGNADPNSGYTVIVGGTPTILGGTSAVAPLYAALTALINAQIGAPIGYLNPALYALTGPVVFEAITVGNNAFGGAPGYVAGGTPGVWWNACAGLGSIHGTHFAATLEGQTNWRYCSKCTVLCFGGGSTPGTCQAGGVHDFASSGDYSLMTNVPTRPDLQAGWEWCTKCSELTFFDGTTRGPCPAGGSHAQLPGSGSYTLITLTEDQAGQSRWMWCSKCQALCFGFITPSGPCPGGGTHALSGNYVLVQNLGFGTAGQTGWEWCSKCQALCFAGSPTAGMCPGGGSHNTLGSYMVIQNTQGAPDDQANWQWCNKCQVLCFAADTAGPCQNGGVHDHAGSGNYLLIDNVAAAPHEQSDWMWCSKCQELAFAGSSTPGPCPAGGLHNHPPGGNYAVQFAA